MAAKRYEPLGHLGHVHILNTVREGFLAKLTWGVNVNSH